MARVKTTHVVFGLLGSSAAFLGLYLFLLWRKKHYQGKKISNEKKFACQRKLFNGETASEELEEQADVTDVEPSESFASSITSFSDNVTALNPDDVETSASSSESSSDIQCAVGVSTYKDATKDATITMETRMDKLETCPIVTKLFADDRCPAGHGNVTENEPEMTSQNNVIVVEYEGPLTPIDVNETVQTVGGTYSNIVPPLQPYTGNIISPRRS